MPDPLLHTVPGRYPSTSSGIREHERGTLDVTVVLPCFNEEGHVRDEVLRISGALDRSGRSYEVLAVDDASTDGTLAVLHQVQQEIPRLRVMAFAHNGGSGTVRRIGTREAFGRLVAWTDADMTYPNERIPELVDLLEAQPDLDQVVGARTSEQGTHKMLRVPAKWAVRRLAEVLTSTRIPDLNSGLRVFRRATALPYLHLLPPGFSCVTTLTLSFLSNQHRVEYVPVEYLPRQGRSKFHFVKDAYRYLLQVLRMVMFFNPLAALMPVALTLLAAGAVKTIFDWALRDFRMATNTLLLLLAGLIILAIGLLADLIVRSRAPMLYDEAGPPRT